MECQKSAFKLASDQHYLNCAYMSPMLRSQEEALQPILEKCYNPASVKVEDFFEPTERLKSLYASVINTTEVERIAVIPSASYGVSTVARNLELVEGDEIIVTHGQFPSNIYAWMDVCNRYGARLISVEKPHDGESWSQAIIRHIGERTKVVAIGHVHWADGTVFNLEQIAENTRNNGALLIIDGTQSIGALRFPMDRVRPDALICGGYKWLLGPYSIGVAYYGPWFDDKEPIEHNWIHRKNSNDFRALVNYQSEYRTGAARFSVGESSNFLLTALFVEGLDQLLKWGVDDINDYCRHLTEPYLQSWREMGYHISAEEEFSPHLFGIGLPDASQRERFQALLTEHRLHVSFRGDAIRVSPHVYNDTSDIETLNGLLSEFAT